MSEFELTHPEIWGEREYADGGNAKLHRAKDAKNDEFYTRYEDVEKEVAHYPGAFKDKVVYCNCDQEWSAFPRFFEANRKELGLKDVIAHPGPFGGQESIALLKTADIVATNPPFSHFRAFVSQLFQYRKDFLIVGAIMAARTKIMFSLIMTGSIWLGSSPRINDFDTPSGGMKSAPSYWYTNLDHVKRPPFLTLTKQYDAAVNPVYDNYDAIEVSRSSDIPSDYDGVMGVPVTFIEKFNPDQFDIIGTTASWDSFSPGNHSAFIDGIEIAGRILIRHKHPVGD